MAIALAARAVQQQVGDVESELEGLHAVEPRVARRLIAVAELVLGHAFGTTHALGDVVAGELDVDPAGHGAERLVHLEEAEDLVGDVVVGPRLVTGSGLASVAVHRVADPHHRVTARGDLLDDGWKVVADHAATHADDECQAPRDPVGVEPLRELDRLLRGMLVRTLPRRNFGTNERAVFAVAAILTPPDPFSMMSLAIPGVLLYEISIWCVWLIERRRKRDEAAESA